MPLTFDPSTYLSTFQVPEFVPGRPGSQIARTPQGGVFVSVSGLKTFRECPQKFFYGNVLGLKRRVEEDEFTIGGLYGAGVQAWRMTGDRRQVHEAVTAELTRRYPDQGILLPDEREKIEKITLLARRWVLRYVEIYPTAAETNRAIASEWPFAVQLPGSPHWLLGFWDLPTMAAEKIGFSEFKTTSEGDKGKYLGQYRLNDQIFAYTFAAISKLGLSGLADITLDVCVKPRIKWENFEKDVKKEVTFWRHPLFPLLDHVSLWANQAARTADQIAKMLDASPGNADGGWVRHYQNCLGAFFAKPCFGMGVCVGGDASDLIQSERKSVTADPSRLLGPRER